mmetsp:Transcript_14903/g.44998  ORF Transcript_14903/g.44998 Transcript_14903/m.44998 type:complete len:235 (-) Transcript_14903:18-722(-)
MITGTARSSRSAGGPKFSRCGPQKRAGPLHWISPSACWKLVSIAPRRPQKRRARVLWYATVLVLGAACAAATLFYGFTGFMRMRWDRTLRTTDYSQIEVNGSVEQFTLLVLTYSARLSLLHRFTEHYSRCNSVAEILVVWNKGPIPDASDFKSKVPVRIRAEKVNSLNNRFREDGLIKTKAVLSLDDDIFVPCGDIELAFAHWRHQPGALVGFHPRLAEGSPLQYTPERNAVSK